MIEVLDAIADNQKWMRVLELLPEERQDVYFSPDYVALSLPDISARAIVVTFKVAQRQWIHPFLIQPILRIGNQLLPSGWFDIETAYGYGGPLSNCDDHAFLAEAHSAYDEWCESEGVVAEFLRLHPILGNRRWLDPSVQVAQERTTFSIDLCQNCSRELPFDGKMLNMVRRAERLGVHVEKIGIREGVDRFMSLYHSTMRAVGAHEEYFFSKTYFDRLASIVERTGFLLVAVKDSLWIAASLFLMGKSLLHYHLSCSDPESRLPGASNLLIYQAAQIGRKAGLQRFHLGGGRVSGDSDSLFKFKRSLASDCHSFFIGKRIHNNQRYALLKKIWLEEFPNLESTYGNRLLCYRYCISKKEE